ncbi:MAG: PilZ domain-containing protein [Proteobacteria bacterium]|nr:PilZ domain-containing protein [Pseudomonadota bacterium]
MGASERRENQRAFIKFEINYIQEGDFLISHSKDISADGMFINTDTPLTINERLTLTFSLGNSDPFTVDARVIWINQNGDQRDKGMGVQFVRPTKKLQNAILSVVNKVAVIEKENKKSSGKGGGKSR